MYSTREINLVHLSVLFLIVAGLAGTIQARTVYVITDRYSTVAAYDIQGDQIVGPNATAQNLPDYDAVGLALDPDSETLFVTYESSNIIEMVNAKTMISEENPVTVPGATNLSGIVFDQTKQKLYVVDRTTKKLFVFLWEPVTKTLTLEGGTYKTLTNLPDYPGAYGIALDEETWRRFIESLKTDECSCLE